MKQQVVLQDPASTAANSRSNLTFSGWKVHFKRNLRHLLTWLYIEESTSKHRVPAEPLHPAWSNCRPAKRRVLTPPRARKSTIRFRWQVPSSLATDWQHRKGSPLGGKCRFWRLEWSISLPFQWPHSANNHTSQWGDTFNGHHSAFFTTNSSVEQVDWPHSPTPTNHELTAHAADKETLLLNCHCTF